MIRNFIGYNENTYPNSANRRKLKKYFGGFFNDDGAFDFDRFKAELEKDENMNFYKEGYELKFLGSSYARLQTGLETKTVITPDIEMNSKPENVESDNAYIVGDNLDALKHLLKSYSSSIKCIYIDPPYNTGNDGFVYPDKFDFTIDILAEKAGITEDEAERILQMAGTSTHSAWLSFMLPRLYLARELLHEEGIIFISIDDNEKDNLKLLCDDIFGEDSCMGCIVRSTGQTTGQDSGGLGSSFDYVLVYSKIPDVDLNGIPLNEHDVKRFNNEDDYGKYALDQMRKTGSNDRREDRPNMYYAVKDPDGNNVYPIGPSGYDGRWRFEKKTYEKMCSEDYIVWKKTKKEGKLVWWPYVKYYLEGRTKRPSPLWTDLDGNKKATREVRELFGGVKVFDYVKPLQLIERLIMIAPHLEDDDIVLDFFSGSATTAHAVMNYNAKFNKKLKYILVQIPEKCKEDTPAYIAGYKSIDEIGRKRIELSANKIKEQEKVAIDYGYKTFYLNEVSDVCIDKMISFNGIAFDNYLDMFKFNKADSVDTILQTWMVADGYGFTHNYEKITLDQYVAYLCDETCYLIDDGITSDDIRELVTRLERGELLISRIVLFGYSFNFTQLGELKRNVNLLKNVGNIKVLERY